MEEDTVGCVEPAGGPVGAEPQISEEGGPQPPAMEVEMTVARVGHEAPDFEANAFVAGGFKKVKLSDYRGKWLILCFYPGDFTFV